MLQEKVNNMTTRPPRSYRQWREMRLKSPAKFYQPKMQARMMEDCQTLKDDFWDQDTIKRINDDE